MNVFQDTLRRIAERVEGTQAVSLVGVDGIPIDSYCAVEGVSVESFAAELGAFVKAAQGPTPRSIPRRSSSFRWSPALRLRSFRA
jgi:predicted regulator of Ras-like GTPase activity (Roadblock/LC7/MglB family)